MNTKLVKKKKTSKPQLENERQYIFRLNRKSDADIIAFMDQVPKMQKTQVFRTAITIYMEGQQIRERI